MANSLLFLHLVFASLWIGGMIYSFFFLRPALKSLPKEQQSILLKGVFSRFFLAVWVSILALFVTGMGLWHGRRPDLGENPLFHIKLFLFSVMFLIFSYIHLYLFRRMKLSSIPPLIAINLFFGIIIILLISIVS
ncbi:MAG: DUF4149 domain-containing protein [Aquificaceae bacterium]